MRESSRLLTGGLIVVLSICRFAQPAPPTSQPSTSPSPDANDPRVAHAVENLVPADVREGKRKATDKEKLAALLLMFAIPSTQPSDARQEQENSKSRVQTQQAVDDLFREQWEAHKNGSREAQQELRVVERLNRERLKLFNYYTQPHGTYPTPAAATDALVKRIEQIPRIVDEVARNDTEAKYHDKRLEVLDKIDELRARPPSEHSAAALRAAQSLLDATDKAHAAEVLLDSIESTTTQPSTRP
jgi:hypothetical protein